MTALSHSVRNAGTRWLAALLIIPASMLALPLAARAAPALDGSAPMLCSLAVLMECDAVKCERTTAAEADLPDFVRIDVPNKAVTAVPGTRQTAIRSSMRLDGRLILQGGENGRGWTATVADSGKLT